MSEPQEAPAASEKTARKVDAQGLTQVCDYIAAKYVKEKAYRWVAMQYSLMAACYFFVRDHGDDCPCIEEGFREFWKLNRAAAFETDPLKDAAAFEEECMDALAWGRAMWPDYLPVVDTRH